MIARAYARHTNTKTKFGTSNEISFFDDARIPDRLLHFIILQFGNRQGSAVPAV